MIGFKLPNKIFGFISKYCFAKVYRHQYQKMKPLVLQQGDLGSNWGLACLHIMIE